MQPRKSGMMTTLLDRFVRFSAYSARPDEHTTGRGHIRAVYALDPARVPNVVVEVSHVESGDKVRLGDFLTLNMMEVSSKLEPDARAILIDDADPPLSVRASVCCRNAGWTTLGQLADLTPAEMLRARNLGRKVLNEIRTVLAANGLSLRGEA